LKEPYGEHRRDSSGASAGARSVKPGYCGIGIACGSEYESAVIRYRHCPTPDFVRGGAQESVSCAESALGKTARGKRSASRGERWQTNYPRGRFSPDQSGNQGAMGKVESGA